MYKVRSKAVELDSLKRMLETNLNTPMLADLYNSNISYTVSDINILSGDNCSVFATRLITVGALGAVYKSEVTVEVEFCKADAHEIRELNTDFIDHLMVNNACQ